MYKFRVDWFSHNIPVWEQLLAPLKGKPELRVLEIGSYQGRSTVWLLENILTDATASIDCVDTFEGSVEHTPEQKQGLLELFMHNTRSFGDKVRVHKGRSFDVLHAFEPKETYDMIYVDGDHTASSVLEDAVLSLPLLKKGGIMIFDDYEWTGMPRMVDRPQIAINAFTAIYADKVRVIHRAYQLAVQKV
jgi:predicted O-methyltransferase YrrM